LSVGNFQKFDIDQTQGIFGYILYIDWGCWVCIFNLTSVTCPPKPGPCFKLVN
jgi:hypothetical protein